MEAIYIQQEIFEPDHHAFQIDGELKSLFYIGTMSDDYIAETKEFLIRFLSYQKRFPIYCIFTTYGDDDEIIEFLRNEKIAFTITKLIDKGTTISIEGIDRYNVPAFKVIIEDETALRKSIREFFWFASSNQFMALSFSDNLTFRKETIRSWFLKRKVETSVPYFSMHDPTTFITLFHDGQGCYILSNEESFSTIESLRQHLPDEIVIDES